MQLSIMDKEKPRKSQMAGSEAILLTKVSIGVFLVLSDPVHLPHMRNTKIFLGIVVPLEFTDA